MPMINIHRPPAATSLSHPTIGHLRLSAFAAVALLSFGLAVPQGLYGDVTLSGNTSSTSNNYVIGIDTSTPNPATMVVDGGSVVAANAFTVGAGSGAQGTVTVTGASSALTITNGLTLGANASTTAIFNVTGGAHVSTSGSKLSSFGDKFGSTATINVSGTSDGTLTGTPSTLTLNVGYTLGKLGPATLNITDGGQVIANPASIPTAAMIIGGTGAGSLLISGANSTYSGTKQLTIGAGAQGLVTVTNGGTFRSVTTSSAVTQISVGVGNGTVTVDGTGSSFYTSGNLTVGRDNVGILNVTGGATATSLFNTAYTSGANFGVGQLGVNGNSSGTVNVSGAGSTWNTAGNLYIGDLGSGTLNITSGGVINSVINNGTSITPLSDFENIFLGFTSQSGNVSSGTVLVDGAGSQWNVTGNSDVIAGDGYSGGSTNITVRNGGAANLSALVMYGDGKITVSGTNSVMTTGQLTLWTANNTTAHPIITVINGGVLNNIGTVTTNPFTGSSSQVGAEVTVDGAASKWNVAGKLIISNDPSTGLITLKNGGTLSVYTDSAHQTTGVGDGELILGGSSGSSNAGSPRAVGILNIGDGGTPGIVNAATVRGYLDSFYVGNPDPPGLASDSTIVFNHNQNNYYFTNTGTSSGTGVVIGGSTKISVVAGTTILTADSTTERGTTVNGGKLIINNPGGSGTSGTGKGSITVGVNGTLGGAGRITPATVSYTSGLTQTSYDVTVQNSIDVFGTIAPGSVDSNGVSTLGTLTIDSGSSTAAHILTLESGATLQFDLGAGLTSDRLSLLNGSVADLLFNSNIINFTDLSHGHLTAGNYILFTADALADYSGLFSGTNNQVTGLTMGTGLESYTANLAMSGNNLVLQIAAVPEPTTFMLLVGGLLLVPCFLRRQKR